MLRTLMLIYLVALLLIPLKLQFVGGNGRRLTAFALESEGYTGTVHRSATARGKFMLHIAPLQEEIDLTPLPVDAPEFSFMPKAACTQSKMVMPLQMLVLHVQGGCEGTSRMTLSNSEVRLICHILRCRFSLCQEISWPAACQQNAFIHQLPQLLAEQRICYLWKCSFHASYRWMLPPGLQTNFFQNCPWTYLKNGLNHPVVNVNYLFSLKYLSSLCVIGLRWKETSWWGNKVLS